MIICGSWGGVLLVWTEVYKLCLMWSSKDDLPVTWPYPLALQNVTGRGMGVGELQWEPVPSPRNAIAA